MSIKLAMATDIVIAAQAKLAKDIEEPDNKKLAGIKTFYHGSPTKLLNLGGPTKELFVTPHKGIASLFTLDKAALRKLLGNPRSSSWGYPAWALPDEQLREILPEIIARHSIQGAKPLKGNTNGYMYTLDLEDSLISPFGKSPLSREGIYTGPELTPTSMENINIPYTAEFSTNELEKLLRMKR